MSELKGRLDRLKRQIQNDDFLFGKGLSNEVNIWIFCYDPTEEMVIRQFVDTLVAEPSLKCNVHNYDLYKVFLGICEDKKIISKIPKIENSKGKEFLLYQMRSITTDFAFISKMRYEPQIRGKDVILLSGVGDVFPFMRVHALLEAMQPHFPHIPILVMYPGSFQDSQLKLFNKLNPNSYYRAFNII